MEAEHILNRLNEPQKEAVTSGPRPVMVVAGAGSGKTRVLVYRVAWLIAMESIAPQNIFAVTFTNKAATEMQTRIQKIISAPARGMWVGTFHGLAHRFLRLHWQEAGLQQGFQILDSDDQYRQIRRLLKSMGFDENHYPPKEIQWFINGQKDLGLRPDMVKKDPATKKYIDVYQAYEQGCERAGLVDFGELLLRFYETLKKNDALLGNYQTKFKHILVDEFQDTNEIQYQMVKLLSGPESSTFIVGDDDQSIYRWRGAKSENMQRFQKDFGGCRIIKLEQNYRSTKTILTAANAIIANNQQRLSKELWTEGEEGEPIAITSAYDEYEEAQNIVNKIITWKTQGGSLSDAAVLYRSNAQSRVIEEALLQLNIPYRVYGGMRFFDRAEIKDVLSYLRLVTNTNDDVAFERSSGMPPKGMGTKTMSQIRAFAKEHNASLFSAASSMLEKQELKARAFAATDSFLKLIHKIKSSIEDMELPEQFEKSIELSGLVTYLKSKKTEKSETRIDNISELVNAAYGYRPLADEEGLSPLQSFLSHAALESGDNQAAEWEDSAQLMTMHSAKGLEFKLVFIAGMEDGLFPHQRSILEPGGLEEERRLCYVAITRSMQELVISFTQQRMLHGTYHHSQPSRFLLEIPEKLIDETHQLGQLSQPRAYLKKKKKNTAPHESGFKLGQRVQHSSFGDGTIIGFEGIGDHAMAQVNFEDAGVKWLVLEYAKLKLM
jgi:DNA helicase-2/ATP-dependent DNA helicase PcrA